MADMRRIGCRLLVGLICLLAVGHLAWGSPSGLNNISTTDVVPEKVLVFQTWFNFANNAQYEQYIGFKTGIFKGLELGADWRASGATHGHAMLQIKYAFDLDEDKWKGVIGVANVSGNTKHNGEVYPYVGTSLDLKTVRLHLGYAPQPHSESVFAGIDRTVPFFDRKLQLKGDVVWVHHRNDAVFSVGFLYEFGRQGGAEGPAREGLLGFLDDVAKDIILEAWVSMPTTGGPEAYTVKLNYVVAF